METHLLQYFYILEIEISVEIYIATQEFGLKLMSNTAKQEFGSELGVEHPKTRIWNKIINLEFELYLEFGMILTVNQ